MDEKHAEQLGEMLANLGFVGSQREPEQHVIDYLTKNWEQLAVEEYNEYLLFPDELVRRKSDGTWERKAVMLRVPREHELRKARIEARALAAVDGIDEQRDRDLFANLENLCVLARAIRNNTSPYEPWEPDPLVLERTWDKVCLQALWAKIDRLNSVLNPAPDQLTPGEVVALIAAIAKARHLGPLVVYGPDAQTSFVVSTVDLLLNSLGSKFSSESLERLTRES